MQSLVRAIYKPGRLRQWVERMGQLMDLLNRTRRAVATGVSRVSEADRPRGGPGNNLRLIARPLSCGPRYKLQPPFLLAITVSLALYMSGAEIAAAGSSDKPRYEIVDGENYAVCQAFHDLLADRTPENPMICGVELGENGHGLSKPDWTKLDVGEHFDLFRRLEQTADGRGNDRSRPNDGKRVEKLTPEEYRREFQWRLEQNRYGAPELLKTRLNLDGEDGTEYVLAIGWGDVACRRGAEEHGYADTSGSGYYLFDVTERVYSTLEYDEEAIESVNRLKRHPVIFQKRAFLVATYLGTGSSQMDVRSSSQLDVDVATRTVPYWVTLDRCKVKMQWEPED